MSKQRFLPAYSFLVFWIVLLWFESNAHAVTFEEMMAGFEKCKLNNVYVDIRSKKPVHPYFLERQLRPCKWETSGTPEVGDDFAIFCLNENFYGLPVYELLIPAGTFDVLAIKISLPVGKARAILRKKFGDGFRKNKKSENGEKPELISDPFNPEMSVLMCNPRD